MSTETRKKIVACSPFLICGYVADKLCWLFRQSSAIEPIYRFMETVNNFGKAFINPLPSIHPIDLCFGIFITLPIPEEAAGVMVSIIKRPVKSL